MPILADYVWSSPIGFRWKTRVFHEPLTIDESGVPIFPEWDFDGSSTGQAEPEQRSGCTEVRLVPAFVCDDPMRPGYDHPRRGKDFCRGYIVLCDITQPDGAPLTEWRRPWAKDVLAAAAGKQPWFGIEQEFYLFDPRTRTPAGFPDSQHIRPQGPYYCRMGENNGRGLIEKHMEMCLSAGLKVSGTNAEVGPSQWEYQIGPCEGIEAADQLMVSRYLLDRLAESAGLAVSWNPKPILGDWNGSGCHVNYSTNETRGEMSGVDAYTALTSVVKKLETAHADMVLTFSSDNRKRLVGGFEAPRHDVFSWGVATRNTSVRIPSHVANSRAGYLEDRRPGSDMDPYLTLGTIVYADMQSVIDQCHNTV